MSWERRTRTWRIDLILLFAGLVVLVLLAIFLLQSRLIFFPERDHVADPGDVGLEFSEVFLQSKGDPTISGWYVPAPDPEGVLLFCHGNAGNISHRLPSIRFFHELGLTVFIFDYRGYGKSEGGVSEQGTYADAERAWRHLVEDRGHRPDEIIVFGRSLGGAVAVELATRHNPGALIVESTFTTLPDLGARIYPWLPVRLLSRFQYDSASRVSGLTCPKLFIHSRDDDVVPFELGRRLHARAAEPKSFLAIRGGHNEGFHLSGDTYREGVRAFVASALAGPD